MNHPCHDASPGLPAEPNHRCENHHEACQARFLLQKKLLYVIAHDLRHPLTTLRLCLEMTSAYRELEPLNVAAMERAVESMNWMVERLLLLARSEGETIPFDPKPVNLAKICERSIALVQCYRLAHHYFDLRVTAYSCILIDPIIVEQILCNLLSNAFKYSPAGGRVTLAATIEEKTLRIEVSDQGVGMSPEEVNKLYSIFFRSPRNRNLTGTGLGLFGTKLLVERHGGHVDCHSILGLGTKFTVTLPIEKPSICDPASVIGG